MRTAVLISGRGSNLQALAAAAAEIDFPAEIVTVVSNEPEAPGLLHARAAGLTAEVVSHRAFADKAAFEAALDQCLARTSVELICLAGFMRVLSAAFCRQWHGKIINIHPSLLPAFPGLDTHARALAAGVRLSGCSVHFVEPEVDGGAIIGQSAVAVQPDDTPQSLAARVLAAEHRLYPRCLAMVASGEVKLAKGRALWAGPAASGIFANPPL